MALCLYRAGACPYSFPHMPQMNLVFEDEEVDEQEDDVPEDMDEAGDGDREIALLLIELVRELPADLRL